jgi:ferric-dicitrate binding protein FerR (iron transport regulator)
MPGDALQSGRENLDMQLTGQVALRMKPDTSLNVGRDPSERRVNLEKGEVVLKFEKDTGGLSVRAPAAQVDADGSTLSVRTTDKDTDVKVFELREGKVIVSPSLPELEGKTRSEIEADPELKKMDNLRASLSRPVASKSSASLPAVLDSASAKSPEVQAFTPTRREIMETRALVTVDEKALQSAADRPGDNQSRQNLIDSFAIKSDAALTSIEKDLQQIVLTSDADIMQQYGLVESLALRDGKTIRGATLTQAGDTLVVHAVRRVLRVRTGELLYIDYIHREETP